MPGMRVVWLPDGYSTLVTVYGCGIGSHTAALLWEAADDVTLSGRVVWDGDRVEHRIRDVAVRVKATVDGAVELVRGPACIPDGLAGCAHQRFDPFDPDCAADVAVCDVCDGRWYRVGPLSWIGHADAMVGVWS